MQWLDPDWAFLVYWMANVWTWVLLLKPACVQHRTMPSPGSMSDGPEIKGNNDSRSSAITELEKYLV